MKKVIHLDDLLIYPKIGILVDSKTGNQLKTSLQNKFGSLKNAKGFLNISRLTLSYIGKKHIKMFNMVKICNALDITLRSLERNVVSITSHFKYKIKFPYEVTPAHFRVVAHIIGDGSYSNNSAYWIQKDVTPIIKLQNKIFKNEISINGRNCKRCSILNIYTKIVSVALDSRNAKNAEFINKCLDIPKEFQIQILAALIEDEGCIRSKNCSFDIGMTNKEIILGIKNICNKLGYETSNISIKDSRGFKTKDISKPIYNISLYVLGVHRFYKDLMTINSEYSNLRLWKKQNELENYVRVNSGKRVLIRNKNENRIRYLLDNWEKRYISCREINNLFKIKGNTTRSLVRRMFSMKLITKYQRGKYLYLKP